MADIPKIGPGGEAPPFPDLPRASKALSEMVVRIARADCNRLKPYERYSYPQCVGPNCSCWFRQCARVKDVLHDMREPTDAMVAAAWGGPGDIETIWQRMIDAALTDGYG